MSEFIENGTCLWAAGSDTAGMHTPGETVLLDGVLVRLSCLIGEAVLLDRDEAVVLDQLVSCPRPDRVQA